MELPFLNFAYLHMELQQNFRSTSKIIPARQDMVIDMRFEDNIIYLVFSVLHQHC